MNSENQKIIDFFLFSEGLKTEHRHAHKSNGQPESSAEHSWRLSLMLILLAPKLQKELDLLKALKMATFHDIVEIEAKDVPILEHINNKEKRDIKDIDEEKAMGNIHKMLSHDGDEVQKLWDEFQLGETYEAKVVHVIDKFESQIQFLSEDVKKFTETEQESVALLIKNTAELSGVDSYLEQLYLDCGELFRKRTQP